MNSEKEAKYLKIALLVAALLLCVAAILVIPYGFYPFLRLVVCMVAGAAAFMLRGHATLSKHFIPLLVVALLFNPAVPFLLSRPIWVFIDIGIAVYFLTISKKV